MLPKHQRNTSKNVLNSNGIIKQTFLKKEKVLDLVSSRNKSNHYYSGKEGKFTSLKHSLGTTKQDGAKSVISGGKKPKTPGQTVSRRLSQIEIESDNSQVKMFHEFKDEEEGFEISGGNLELPRKKHKIMSFEIRKSSMMKNSLMIASFNDQLSTNCSSQKVSKPRKLATIRQAARHQFQNFVSGISESSDEVNDGLSQTVKKFNKTLEQKQQKQIKFLDTQSSTQRASLKRIQPEKSVLPKTIQKEETEKPQKIEIIDDDKFSLGDGPWTLKKERVKKLIETLVEDENQFKEFRIRKMKSKPRLQLPEPEMPITTRKNLGKVYKMRQEMAQKQREQKEVEKRNQILQKFNKWDLVRQQKERELIAQSENQKRQWRFKQIVSQIKTQQILSMICQNIAARREIRHQILLKSIVSRKLQHYFRDRLLRIGPSGPPGNFSIIRDKKRLQLSILTPGILTFNTIQSRAKVCVLAFLKQQYGYQNLINKVKNFCQQIEKIQNHCKAYNRDQVVRVVILEDLYQKTFRKIQMSLMKAKKNKLEKKLREVKPEVVKNILLRYERFCQDQRAYSMIAWRKKVDYTSLSKKQKFSFNMKLKQVSYHLHNSKGEIIFDSDKLGKPLDFLPSCLDPDTTTRKFERVVLEKVDPQLLNNRPTCLTHLAESRPFDLDFYPTEKIMTKLVMRSAQIQEYKTELWEGFHPVERADGNVSWKPDVLI